MDTQTRAKTISNQITDQDSLGYERVNSMDISIENTVEENVKLPMTIEKTNQWTRLRKKILGVEVLFFFQMFIISFVIGASIYNLTTNEARPKIWVVLLSSCLGILLPNPSLAKTKRFHDKLLVVRE